MSQTASTSLAHSKKIHQLVIFNQTTYSYRIKQCFFIRKTSYSYINEQCFIISKTTWTICDFRNTRGPSFSGWVDSRREELQDLVSSSSCLASTITGNLFEMSKTSEMSEMSEMSKISKMSEMSEMSEMRKMSKMSSLFVWDEQKTSEMSLFFIFPCINNYFVWDMWD